MSGKNTGSATRTTSRPASAKPGSARPGPKGSGSAKSGSPKSAARKSPGESALEAVQQFSVDWGPTIGRVALGLVLAWFGYHELMQPQLWTGYVPLLSTTSSLAVALVLVHGWLLLMLAVALVAGVLVRVAAAVAALLLVEIIISLIVSGGLTDISMRDLGVFGLAVMLTAGARQRLALTD